MGRRFMGRESWDQTITIQKVGMVVTDEVAIGMNTQEAVRTQVAARIGTVEEGAWVRVIIIHILRIRITLLHLCSMYHITLKVEAQMVLINTELEEAIIFVITIPTALMLECFAVHLVFLHKHQLPTLTITIMKTFTLVPTIPFMLTLWKKTPCMGKQCICHIPTLTMME